MKKERHLEEKPHGVPDFPIQFYHVDKDYPRYEMPLHWHGEFEVIRVLSGSLGLYLNNEKHTLRAGEIGFVGSGVLHRGEPCDAVYECIVFDLNMLCRHGSGRITGYVLPLFSGGAEVELVSTASGTLADTVNAFFDCLSEEGPYFELMAYAKAAEMVYLLYTENRIRIREKHVPAGNRRQMIAALVEWIEENYTERITLADLAQVAKTNEKYLCRFFKEYTGKSPIDYVNGLRVERACSKIAEENRTITEAAFDSGFNDMSYFCKIFKRYKGMTPRRYKKTLESHASLQRELSL
ncbi:MAG: helix-turn-helix transcriptional regulator [Clostridia bacterium]|nr:helix-turn-helix transcriptional regulator [Clostridia bacterium]